MGGISVWQLTMIAIIVALLFGTKKLRGIGGDLGSAIKGFKKAMSEDESTAKAPTSNDADFDTQQLGQQQATASANAEMQKDQDKA